MKSTTGCRVSNLFGSVENLSVGGVQRGRSLFCRVFEGVPQNYDLKGGWVGGHNHFGVGQLLRDARDI